MKDGGRKRLYPGLGQGRACVQRKVNNNDPDLVGKIHFRLITPLSARVRVRLVKGYAQARLLA